METSPFELLGLERSTTTRATIVTAYRERAALYHPDRETGNAAKFDAVRKARDECIELIDQPIKKMACMQCKGTGRWHKSHGWGLIEMMCDKCAGSGYE
jgi:DnaJ-class molecular chaperone